MADQPNNLQTDTPEAPTAPDTDSFDLDAGSFESVDQATADEQSEHELVEQIQSLLDEADADAFESPDQVLAKVQEHDESADASATNAASPEIAAAATGLPDADPVQQVEAAQETLDEFDALLAEADEDADAVFESIDAVLDQPTDDTPAVENKQTADLTAAPSPEASAKPVAAQTAEEDWEGDFESPEQVVGEDPAGGESAESNASDSPAPEPQMAAIEAESDTAEADHDIEGSFESIDEIDEGENESATIEESAFEAIDEIDVDDLPDITAEGADEVAEDASSGVFESDDEDEQDAAAQAATESVSENATERSKSREAPQITIKLPNLEKLKAYAVPATRRTADASLWVCGMANLPVRKLNPDIRQAVSWSALAVALPGVAMLVIGLVS
jgi:hypothetical protein